MIYKMGYNMKTGGRLLLAVLFSFIFLSFMLLALNMPFYWYVLVLYLALIQVTYGTYLLTIRAKSKTVYRPFTLIVGEIVIFLVLWLNFNNFTVTYPLSNLRDFILILPMGAYIISSFIIVHKKVLMNRAKEL